MADTPDTNVTPPPDTPKASWIWLKDSSGFPSVTVTFVTIAFWVTTLWFIVSIIHKVGPVEFHAFDPVAATSYLGPILGLYFGRKFTDAKYNAGNAAVVAPPAANPPPPAPPPTNTPVVAK